MQYKTHMLEKNISMSLAYIFVVPSCTITKKYSIVQFFKSECIYMQLSNKKKAMQMHNKHM